MKQLSKAILLSLVALLLVGMPVLAAVAYRAPYTITETDGNPYGMLPVIELVDNTWLADNGFMLPSAQDTRIETLGGLQKPHMVVDDRTLTAVDVPANSQTNLYFTTANTAVTFDIIEGYGGFITVFDDDDLKLGDTFEIEIDDTYIDTSVGAGKYLVYKQDAISIYTGVVAGEVAAGIPSAGNVYNSDADAEDDSVDGYITYENLGGVTWDTIHDAGDGTAHDDDGATLYVGARCDAVADRYDRLQRTILSFLTAPIPDGSPVTAGTLQIKGTGKLDQKPWGDLTLNVFAASPASVDDLVNGDYDEVAAVPFATPITFAAFNDAGWNTFTLNAAGLAYINDTGVTEFSIRDATYDAPDVTLTYASGNEFRFIFNSADSAGNEPILTLTYDDPVVTAINVSTGQHDVTVSGNGALFEISVDSAVAGDGHDSAGIGAGVPPNNNDWILMDNRTTQFMPYMGYYKHTTNVGAYTLKAHYQPDAIVVNTDLDGICTGAGALGTLVDDVRLTQADDYWNGALVFITDTTDDLAPEGEYAWVTDFNQGTNTLTFEPTMSVATELNDTFTVEFGTLIDLVGGDEPGIIGWGVNPDGVAVTLGGMISEGQAAIEVELDGASSDVMPAVGVTDWFIDPAVGVGESLRTNPLRPFVTMLSDNSTLTEIQSWRLYASALILLITVGTAYGVRSHQGITALMAGVALFGAVMLTIFPMWALFIAIFLFMGGLAVESHQLF